MSATFWKQFEGTPPIDCVQMKHAIQEAIYEETKNMSWEERMAFMRSNAPAAGPSTNAEYENAAVLREEPPVS